MAQDHQSQLQCLECGGNDIATDSRYGNKLKGREFMRRFLKSPVAWIGLLLAAFGGRLSCNPGAITYELCSIVLLLMGGTTLAWIAAEQIYRSVYSTSNPDLYPEARFTCRACEHQWTSEEVPTDAKIIESMQTEAEKSDASATLEPASSAGSGVAEPKRQGTAVVIGALAGVAATLGPPFCMLTAVGGEICRGYQVDVVSYYGRLIPLALLTAAVGALFGRAIGRSRSPATSDATQGQSPGCAIAAAVVVGIGWMYVSLMVAIFPGC